MTVSRLSATQVLELVATGNPRPAIAYGLELLAGGIPVERIILDVLGPVLRQAGELWESNQWRAAHEHAATAVVDGVLGALALETAPRDPPRGAVVVVCAEGEHHTLPARMGVELLRADGWEVTFLGGSLPADDLQRFAAEREPDAVVISCTIPLFLAGARRGFGAVGELGLPAFGAGPAFGDDQERALRLGASGRLGAHTDLAALLELTDGIEPQPAATPGEAIALELDSTALQAACLSLMVERMPVMATYTAAQIDSTRTDLGYMLGFLATAVDLDDDSIFTGYVAWVTTILEARGVPAAVLDGSLSCVREVMDAAGMRHAERLCTLG